MRVFFFPEYSGYVYRDLSNISFNETVQGLSGLLSLLELHSGKKNEENSYTERIFSYKKALERYISYNPSAVFSLSFSVDPFGTSERLLSWRDTLVSYGWKEKQGEEPSRLFEDLKGVERFFSSESIWERLERVRKDIDEGALIVENLEIIIPFPLDSFHPLIISLLSSLADRGVGIRVNETIKRDSNNDLCRVDAFLSGSSGNLELKGDGSFEILSFPSNVEYYRYIATEGDEKCVYIESHPDILDNWLKMENKPVTGSKISGLTEISQLPILGLRLFRNPLNPEYLLSWLTTPSSPVPEMLGKNLANTIVSSGGFFNKKSQSVVDAYLEESVDADSLEKRKRVVKSFLPKKEYYSYGDQVKREDIVSFMDALLHYSFTKQDDSGFVFIANELNLLLSYFDGDERELIPYSEIEGLLSIVYRPKTSVQYESEKDSLSVVSSPASFVSMPNSIIWNGLNDITETQFSSSFLRPVEKEYATTLPYYWREENEIKYQTQSLLIPFRFAEKKVKIVVVVDTENIEDSLINPLLIRIYEKTKDQFSSVVKEYSVSKEKMRKVELFSNDLGENNDYVTFTKHSQIEWPDNESYSSLTNLIYHPLDYFMSSILSLSPKGAAEMNQVDKTMGIVAHRVIEIIFGGKNDRNGITDEQVDKIIEDSIKEKGAILLMDENLSQVQVFRKDLKKCINNLSYIIENNNLRVVKTEMWFDSVDIGLFDHTPISGSADMVLENSAGDLYVFDFKWSKSFSYYKKIIENNSFIQLELYKKALENKTQRRVVFASYVLLPSLSFFTTDNLDGVKKQKIIEGRNVYLLDEIINSYKFRKNEISSGVIEIGDGHAVTDLGYYKDGENLVPLPADNEGNKRGNKFSDYECFKR